MKYSTLDVLLVLGGFLLAVVVYAVSSLWGERG